MTLLDLYNSKNRIHHGPLYTDKQYYHTYISDYYGNEFKDKRNFPLNILEIGIFCGGSIRLWEEWFYCANIVGIDSDISNFVSGDLTDRSLLIFGNAYSTSTVEKFKDNYFDYIIDDGPHTVESQILCVRKWLSKVKPKGKIIIEDIVDAKTAELIVNNLSDMNFTDVKIFDLSSSIPPEKWCDNYWNHQVILEVTK